MQRSQVRNCHLQRAYAFVPADLGSTTMLCIDNAPCRTYHVLEGVIVYVLSHSPFLGCVHCLSSILETVGRKL